ncbi:hypothetical protein DD592_27225, partial [Enterobacter cloacae complex sp. 2DZ2F20B]
MQLNLKFPNLVALESTNHESHIDPSKFVQSLTTLYDCISDALDTHAHFVTKRITHRSIPWFTTELGARIRERDKLFTRAKRSKNLLILEQYRKLRREIKNALKIGKNRYLTNL